MDTEPYFAMTNPPPEAQSRLLSYITKQQRDRGLLSPITGLPVSLITEYSELSPSVKRVVDYLYEHTDCTLDVAGVQKIGGANLKQLNIDIEWLIDQNIVTLVINNSSKVIFLTKRGEEMVYEG